MARDILLFGPPGAGKGTQAVLVSRATGLPHIATGDMFRAHLAAGTPLGRQAKGYMERGELVPDDVTIGMLAERLDQDDAREGFLLDGFPRTALQADALDRLLGERGRSVTRLVSIAVPEEELVRRLSGRLVCREANHPYHETDAPPRQPGRCDVDGSELYRRADDDEATVRRRFRVFTDETEPVLERYRAAGTPISRIDGARPRDVVRDELIAAVEGAAATAP